MKGNVSDLIPFQTKAELKKCNPLSSNCPLTPVSVEFLDSVLMIYQDLLAGKSPNTVIVPTSTSIEQLPSVTAEEKDKEWQQQDGVEPSTLAQCIDALCDRFKHR